MSSPPDAVHLRRRRGGVVIALGGSIGLLPPIPQKSAGSALPEPPRFNPPARKGGRSCTLLDGPPTAEGFPALDPPLACCWRPPSRWLASARTRRRPRRQPRRSPACVPRPPRCSTPST